MSTSLQLISKFNSEPNERHNTFFQLITSRCAKRSVPVCLLCLLSVNVLFILPLYHNQYLLSSTPWNWYSNPPAPLPFESVTVEDIASRFPHKPHFSRRLKHLLDIIVEDYGAWHRNQRILCNTNSTHARALRLFVFRGRDKNHGLGDRFRALLHTYLAAVASERLFLIDLPRPFPLASMFQNALTSNFTYDPAIFLSTPDEETFINDKEGFPDLSQYLNSSRVLIQKSYSGLHVGSFFKIAELYSQLPLSQKLKRAEVNSFDEGHSVVASFLLKSLFMTSQSLRRKIRENDPFRGKSYLAAHVRLGIGLGERHSRFDLTYWNLTERTASLCFGRFVGETAKRFPLNNIFLATDTETAITWIKEGVHEIFPEAIVATLEGQATHMSRLSRLRERVGSSRSFKAFERAFVDLGLIARAQGLIAFSSGFSRLAAWMGAQNDLNTVVFHPEMCSFYGLGTPGRCRGEESFNEVKVRTVIEKKIMTVLKVTCNSTS